MGKGGRNRAAYTRNDPQFRISSPRGTYERPQTLTSTTLILKVNGPVDAFAVAERPGESLLDIFEHEAEAAALWQQRRQRDKSWNEGLIQLRYQETDLIETSLIDDVVTLWYYLMNLADEFLETGRAEVSFPDQPVPIVMETIQHRAFFSVGTTRVMIDPALFINSLADEAERFFDWTSRNLGEGIPSNQIASIRERLAR